MHCPSSGLPDWPPCRRRPRCWRCGAGRSWRQPARGSRRPTCSRTAWLATSWPCSRDREIATLEGLIAAPPLARAGRTDFDFEVSRSETPGSWPRRVRVSWYEADQLPAVGERWRFELRLRCRRGFLNPGAPDRELALLRERIDATAYVAGKSRPARIGAPVAKPIERLRARIAGAVAGCSASGSHGRRAAGPRGRRPRRHSRPAVGSVLGDRSRAPDGDLRAARHGMCAVRAGGTRQVWRASRRWPACPQGSWPRA